MQVPNSFQNVTRDILDLCELQMQLLSVDSQAARRKMTRAAVYGLTAMASAGAALTVLLVGLGFLLHELADLSAGTGLLIVGGVTFLIVLGLLAAAWFAVRSAASDLNETKSEFAENLRWLKATIVSPGSSPRHQLRSETFPEFDERPRQDRYTPEPVSPLSSR